MADQKVPAQNEATSIPACSSTQVNGPAETAGALPEGAPPEEGPPVETPKKRAWLSYVGAVAVVVGLAGLVVFFEPHLLRGDSGPADAGRAAGNDPATALSVNTVRPERKTLVRIFQQPGSVEPWAEAELHAKVSGYLKSIAREVTPEVAAEWTALALASFLPGPGEPPAAAALQFAAGAHRALSSAPEKDLGSTVRAGEVLLEIDAPERVHAIVEKEAAVHQREEELEQARTMIDTFAAAVEVAKARQVQAEADVKRYHAEHALRLRELERVSDLVRHQALEPRLQYEKEAEVAAALGAWESSRAKVQGAAADRAHATTELATARSNVRVKEAQLGVARAELHGARVLANYAYLRAPFDGVITSRNVDEGDFVQNARSGQPRPLMTVTAVDRVKIALQVPERQAIWVRLGAEAVVHLDARTSWEVTGHVARIGPSLDQNLRTRRVEIDLDNRDGQLMPGMYGQVSMTLQRIENALAIPATAVYSRRGENYIIVARDGVAHRQRVRIRYDDGKELEVVKLVGNAEVPLNGSEELVVSNKGEIADGQRVRTTHPPVAESSAGGGIPPTR